MKSSRSVLEQVGKSMYESEVDFVTATIHHSVSLIRKPRYEQGSARHGMTLIFFCGLGSCNDHLQCCIYDTCASRLSFSNFFQSGLQNCSTMLRIRLSAEL